MPTFSQSSHGKVVMPEYFSLIPYYFYKIRWGKKRRGKERRRRIVGRHGCAGDALSLCQRGTSFLVPITQLATLGKSGEREIERGKGEGRRKEENVGSVNTSIN